MAFILEQAQIENQGIIDAFDQIRGNGNVLLSLCVPLIGALIGFAMLNFQPKLAFSCQPILPFIALLYADLLGFCCVRLWGVVRPAELAISGIDPRRFFNEHPEVLKWSLAQLHKSEAIAHKRYISDNRTKKDQRADLFKSALLWFIWSLLVCIAVSAASAALVWFFGAPRPALFGFWLWLGEIYN